MNASRRSVLRLSALGIARLLLPPLPPIDRYTDGPSEESTSIRPLLGFGRGLNWAGVIRSEPHLNAPQTGKLMRDQVLPIYAEIETDSGTAHNKLWYEVKGGYVHSSTVHVVEWQLNRPETQAGENGFWAELTVPFFDVRSGPALSAPRNRYRYYGGTVYKVINVVRSTDPTDQDLWYQIEDEIFAGLWFVPGKYMRRIPDSDFSPLSSDVDPAEKRLVVDLRAQRVHAFERDREVFSCRAATGAQFQAGDFSTPIGRWFIFRKTPTQHMYGGAVGDEGSFDLPGIPWVCYFTTSGVAFHGTYWHNDFGMPRSHGCVNVTSPHAKWIWRWSMPPNNPAERYIHIRKAELGTPVIVQ
ncbi:MAG: L,D-transpeptidase [Anaerolineae bacterium]|nr:L,D-transpeptidase [Thermoflexales bacterium]MDW8407761.1 L,D-transpeptidase [Anaerolineae bacterium]